MQLRMGIKIARSMSEQQLTTQQIRFLVWFGTANLQLNSESAKFISSQAFANEKC